jgi:hypothetical protein
MPKRVTRDTPGQYGSTILETYAEDGSTRRTIFAANDGGNWKFDQIGTPYTFEDPALYRKKKIRDRFTPEVLKAYLEKLGIHAFDSDWYLPPNNTAATLITRTPTGIQQYAEYSLGKILESWRRANPATS